MQQTSYGTLTITDTTDIARVQNWYLASSSSSGVKKTNSGWTTDVTNANATMTATKQYLWNYEQVQGEGANGSYITISTTDPVIIGRYGQTGAAGRGITSIDEYYQVTNSTTNPGSSGWQKNTLVAPTSTNRYLWNYQVINYTNPTSTQGTYNDARIIGVYGDKGETGTSVTNISSSKNGDTTTVTVTLSDGTSKQFTVKDGVQGDTGATAQWYYGTDLTHTSGTATLATSKTSGVVVGSMYLNSDTSLCYRCTAVNTTNSTATWTYAGDLTTGVINNIEIGGRNLAWNSKLLNIQNGQQKKYISKRRNADIIVTRDDGFGEIHSYGSSFGGIDIYSSLFDFQVGDVLTLSFYAKYVGNLNTPYISFYPMMYKNGSRNTSIKIPISFDGGPYVEANSRRWVNKDGSYRNLTTSYEKYSVTFIWTQEVADLDYVEITAQAVANTWTDTSSNSYISIYMPKLERGNVATDWTPAPQDTESRISSMETAIEETNEAIALKANASDVYTKTDTDGLINTQVTNRNAAITAKANEITSSVSSTYETKTDASNKLTEAKGYADTEIASAEASIKQTTDSITSRVTKTETKIAGHYATCPTAAATQAKIATISPTVTNWELYSGAQVAVKFTYANTHATPTLNVNSSGAKAIKSYTGVNLSEAEYKWKAGATLTFVYNNSNWLLQDGGTTTRISSAESSITQNADNIALKVSETDITGNYLVGKINLDATTATISADKVNIEGAAIFTNDGRLSETSLNNAYDSKGSAASVQTNLTTEINQRKAQYGTSSTAAGTADKVVTCANFELVAGNEITVKFSTANTSSGLIRLNVNSKGVKNVWVANAVTSSTNQLLWGANAYITFRYDGSQFIVIGEPRSWYGASTTAAATAAKTDTTAVTGCVICKGAKIELAMSYNNTNTSATLNIRSTGAKAIYYGNTTTRPTVDNGHSWLGASTATFTFDGQFYRMAGQTVISGDSITTGTIDANRINASELIIGSSTLGTELEQLNNIGGRNLVYDSSLTGDMSKWGYNETIWQKVTKDNYECLIHEGALNTAATLTLPLTINKDINNYGVIPYADLTFTFSADVLLEDVVKGTTNYQVALYGSGAQVDGAWRGVTTIKSHSACPSGVLQPDSLNGKGWTRVWHTFKYGDYNWSTYIRPIFYARDYTGKVYVKNVKLEYGTVHTDWSPAPEDTEAAIDTVKTDFSFANETMSSLIQKANDDNSKLIEQLSKIEQTLNEIKLRVSSVANNKTFYAGEDISSYITEEPPTLLNYPTFTDFFIWPVCDTTLSCDDTLNCGTNNYAAYENRLAHCVTDDTYYIFKKDAANEYYWENLTFEEYKNASSKFSSIDIKEDQISIVSALNSDLTELLIDYNGIKATSGKLFCC